MRMIGWLDHHARALLWIVAATAVVLRGLLVAFSPHEYGYVWDFYQEGITYTYHTRHLPIASTCWQCYHPPLFYILGTPLYALGQRFFPGSGWPHDPALWFTAVIPLASGFACLACAYRLLRLFRQRGGWLVIGTAVAAAFPCLFIHTFSLEADILLAGIGSAFMYYLTAWFIHPAGRTMGGATRLGALAGLAAATKYSGLVAPAAGVLVLVAALWRDRSRARAARHAAAFLAVALVLGSWRYVDNFRRYGKPLFANGDAELGFSFSGRPKGAQYEFTTFRLRELLALTRPDSPPGMLTTMPVYNSVLTTLHGLAWGDMGFFTNPTRHGTAQPFYLDRHIDPRLASSVLVLGLLPDAMAALGLVLTIRRRALWPILMITLVGLGSYLSWMWPQVWWAVKTKYLLFLFPAYILYAQFGLRWACRVAPWWMSAPLVGAILALIVVANLYLFAFAVG